MTTKRRIGRAAIAAAIVLGLAAGGAAPAIAQAKKPALPPPPKVSPEEFEKAKGIFFDRCAGCHGVLRKGATGPNLLPAKTRAYGTVVLKTFITNGTQGGMPDWGRQGVLSPAEIDLIARYLHHEPPGAGGRSPGGRPPGGRARRCRRRCRSSRCGRRGSCSCRLTSGPRSRSTTATGRTSSRSRSEERRVGK